MTKIMILEDGEENLQVLTAMVKNVSKEIEVVPVRSLDGALEVLQNTLESFRAFLLDINLDEEKEDDLSGIEFARKVRAMRQYEFTPIVMVTSLAHMELQAYRELHCYQYIIKPFEKEVVEELIRKVLSHTRIVEEPHIVVKSEGVNYKVLCKNIEYIKAIPRGVSIVMKKEELTVLYISIKQLMEKLPQELFLQCHRMYVVNVQEIEYLDTVNGLMNMKNGHTVEVGVTYKNDVRKRMNE